MTHSPAVAADKSRELKLRIASALVLAPIVLGLTWIGGTPFALLAVVAGVVMASEWATIVLGRSWGLPRLALLGLVALGVAAGAGLLPIMPGSPVVLLAIVSLVCAAGVAAVEARGGGDKQARDWAVAGPLYAGLPAIALAAVRAAPSGLWLVVFLFAVVWSTDIAAYFTGRAIGGPKLWPAVSPKKTWSGALGGLLAGAVAGVIVAAAAGAPRLWPVFLVGAVLSIASQGGDLFESSLKRRFGVKDSGWIIPGHGGLLDRVDGLVAAAAAAALVAFLNGGLSSPTGGLLVW
jgi:phosphatidate cytidylyltransferase